MVAHTAGGVVVCSQPVPCPVATETLLFRSLQEAVRLTQWKQGPRDLGPNDVTEQKAPFYFSEKNDRVLYRMLLIFLSNRSKEIVDVLPLFFRHSCVLFCLTKLHSKWMFFIIRSGYVWPESWLGSIIT